MTIAFLDVDTQRDFIEPTGKLHARGAEAIRPNLGRLVQVAREARVPIVSSVDAHVANDPEFGQYPPHCLRGTPGQEKIEETRTGTEVFVPSARAETLPDPRAVHVVLEKQVFPIFGNANAEAILERTGADTFYVFGVVTEVCVKAAVLGLLERGRKVNVVSDAIWPIEARAGEAAKKEMAARGARFLTTAEAVREVAPRRLERIEVVADKTATSKCDEGFLRLKRLRLRNHYADGSVSRDYPCDVVSRPGADAVAVVLWHRAGGKVFVHLRLGTRAAVYLRRSKKAELVQPDDRVYDLLEELVAGVLEKG
ncbi:MAG TPA: isochorismatase family cysteine hydrolase, partial [Planctomycetota bacterium]|nr:isochorismatase family cysteine hydrolase [Planctomycetota bacterium]